MEHRQANDVLVKMLKKHKFDVEEKEAILTAIGGPSLDFFVQKQTPKNEREKGEKKEMVNITKLDIFFDVRYYVHAAFKLIN